jgi:hypothetical protein
MTKTSSLWKHQHQPATERKHRKKDIRMFAVCARGGDLHHDPVSGNSSVRLFFKTSLTIRNLMAHPTPGAVSLRSACSCLCFLWPVHIFGNTVTCIQGKVVMWYQKWWCNHLFSTSAAEATVQLNEECKIKNKNVSYWWTLGEMHANYHSRIKSH